ncbi:uncharacterized protein LOC129744334 isoform X2 [Uranotaenia lowii]|uniref:uncharacterized protein LOC129744334 isoform X2 n=1 Tax=Uranotaenia lowii TaxID=190385 RepID=UPI00247AA553|nr:uncharacterized protein LOC129744334 isoform X2 [Uranotaenia lowii]
MTTGPLFKTPASSPPKYPSTPLPTPTPSPSASSVITEGRSVLPQASWSGHSSMASSMSAMSSGGPSSPNYSDMFSRGCPSSEMSASITSTDGIALATGGGVRDDLPQIFPMIDNDLNVLGSHFNYDQLATSISLGSPARIPPISKDATLDISGDLTPISTCSDWEFNTNDATKGSTNTNNDLTVEEDDEDATISTDTCLSTGDLSATNMAENVSPNLNLAAGSTASGKQLQKEFLFDMKNMRHELINSRHEVPTPPTSAPPAEATVWHGTAWPSSKVENNLRGGRIQKQISLYEKESCTEAKNLSHEQSKFGERSQVTLKRATSCNEQPFNRINMSFDELQKEITNVDKNLACKFDCDQEKCLKTTKAMPIRLNNTTPTPGALVIREGFIEPPRITRVTKSFHGKTDYHQVQVNEINRRASDIVRPSTSNPVLVQDNANRYNKNQIRQNINTNSTSKPQSASSSSGVGLCRFTTSIVQETGSQLVAAERVRQSDASESLDMQFGGPSTNATSESTTDVTVEATIEPSTMDEN